MGFYIIHEFYMQVDFIHLAIDITSKYQIIIRRHLIFLLQDFQKIILINKVIILHLIQKYKISFKSYCMTYKSSSLGRDDRQITKYALVYLKYFSKIYIIIYYSKQDTVL